MCSISSEMLFPILILFMHSLYSVFLCAVWMWEIVITSKKQHKTNKHKTQQQKKQKNTKQNGGYSFAISHITCFDCQIPIDIYTDLQYLSYNKLNYHGRELLVQTTMMEIFGENSGRLLAH